MSIYRIVANSIWKLQKTRHYEHNEFKFNTINKLT